MKIGYLVLDLLRGNLLNLRNNTINFDCVNSFTHAEAYLAFRRCLTTVIDTDTKDSDPISLPLLPSKLFTEQQKVSLYNTVYRLKNYRKRFTENAILLTWQHIIDYIAHSNIRENLITS